MVEPLLGGRYAILKPLASGGFGQTYLAEDYHLPGHPQCVVKQLRLRSTDPDLLTKARGLFHREAKVLYKLGEHPQIPRLFAHFEQGGEFYLVQEFIDGTPLSQDLFIGRTLTEPDVIDLVEDILKVLSFVHDNHVIHRDIKPDNLIFRKSDRKLVLIDFGAVKTIKSQTLIEKNEPTTTIAIGSPGYMSNEQLAGKPRFSSDIYALGIIAIQALTGLPPKAIPEDPRTSELCWRDRAKVSAGLGDIIDKMVRYDFRDRYQVASEVLGAIAQLKRPGFPPPSTRKLTLKPDEYLAWLQRGSIYAHQQQYEAAIACYDQAIVIFSDDAIVWLKRGRALAKLHRYQDALSCYDRLVKLEPHNYWSWYDRGQILERLQQWKKAEISYNCALKIQPELPQAIAAKQRCQNALLSLPTVTSEWVSIPTLNLSSTSADSILNRIEVLQGNIISLDVDAIVTSTDRYLSGIGILDHAIHEAAGFDLTKACNALKYCQVGEALITPGYNLQARWLIHTVGPQWLQNSAEKQALLAQCYKNSLALVESYGIRTLAFPSISTGGRGFPVSLAATIAITEVTRFLDQNTSVEKVIFVCFERSTYLVYQERVAKILGSNFQPTPPL